jgi:ATP-dependent helicase HrpB
VTETSVLPIDSILDQLVALASAHSRLVVEAPAGAGKTTRIPPALWRCGCLSGEIWVAEPRRLAAKLMAHRVSSELGQRVGELVGYSVRFDECSSPKTKIRYVTSGILLRRLLADPTLSDVGCVVLDEFHERHLDSDLALALVSRAQLRRPELRLIVMSATLDGARLSELLGGCPRLTSEGRLYPIEIQFQPQPDDRPLEKRVASALRQLLEVDPTGSTLVFLPGAAEIRRVAATIEPLSAEAQVDVVALHGDMPLDAQTKAILPGARPKIVLSTNIAESSITVEGISAVVDSGLKRQRDCSALSGLPRMNLQRISRASATQRAGRAGRTGPGRVIRLYTKGDFESRPEFDVPEILRVDFSEARLILSQAAASLDELLLLDRPSPAAVLTAQTLLCQLGALDAGSRITPLGKRMLGMPLHPRLSRLLLECEQRQIGNLGALVAALLSERALQRTAGPGLEPRRNERHHVFSGESDIVELVELYREAESARQSHANLRQSGVDAIAFRSVQQTHQQLRRLVHSTDSRFGMDERAEEDLAIALLLSFPDRVSKRRAPDSREIVLRSGAAARLSDASVVTRPQWLVAIDAEERREPGRSSATLIRLASAIKEDWLVDFLSDALIHEEEHAWFDPPGRVEVVSRIRIGSLIVDEGHRPAQPGPYAAAVLLGVVEQVGLLKRPEVQRLMARIALISQPQADGSTEATPEGLADGVLGNLLSTRIDLDGLDGATLANCLKACLAPRVVEQLRTHAPEAISLPGGRRCPVNYETGRPPWIASRLQDFFGLAETPTIMGGRQKLIVQLLAPNQRAVQITTDLRGFWANHYGEIRRQLMRRYPRHAWPEDGLSASPPAPRPTHRGR